MNRKPFIFNILQGISLVLILIVTGCSTDTSTSLSGIGRIYPSVTVNPEVSAAPGIAVYHPVDVPADDKISLSITDLDGTYSHTWQSWTDYEPQTGLQASRYRVEAFYGDSTREGFDAPWFYDSKDINVSVGDETEVNLECRLANAMWRFGFSESLKSEFRSAAAYIQTVGQDYIRYDSDETRPVFMKPVKTSVVLSLEMADGRKLNFVAAEFNGIKGGNYYDVEIILTTASDGIKEIRLSTDETITTDDVVIRLTDDFINAPQPEITASGFTSGETITLVRGTSWSSPLGIITSADNLAQLIFSYTTGSACFDGLPREIDLYKLDAATESRLRDCGIVVNKDRDVRVDFTGMLPKLSTDAAGKTSFFSVSAVSRFRKVSLPCQLTVHTLPADFTLVSLSPAVMGVNVCEMELESVVNPEGKLRIDAFDGLGQWQTLDIIEYRTVAPGRYLVRFKVPAGQSDIPIRVYYLGEQKIATSVRRLAPEFTIRVDAFALKAYVEIVPDDPSMLGLITSSVNVFAGSTQVSVIERDEEKGVVTVAGLTGNTPYVFRASLFSNPTDESEYTPAVSVRTERCADIPNGSFEDTKETLKYSDLLSGGRYSQSVVPIFNQQNKVQIALMTPKNWATTNDKTFCMAAKNQNTWYMQPSAYIDLNGLNGGYAMKICSTAWDLDGMAIPDYLQTAQPYTNYSGNIPSIAHRAAGRLFLGSYYFDPATLTERYEEGIGFGSRPSAVNGYYKYLPCTVQPSDKGLVRVEVLGESGGNETVIGSGELRLTSSASYRTFSVPVSYTRPFVKATRLRIMFSSTENAGTIAYETAHIVTYSNPVTSSSLGSELWIDEVSLSY